ncbi:hypothetical protein MCERE10_02195 [Burkholderiaceae bacterium]
MNIELDEVVVQDVSDGAPELAAGGAQGGTFHYNSMCANPAGAYTAIWSSCGRR